MKTLLSFFLFYLPLISLGICQENVVEASISNFSESEKASFSLFLEQSEHLNSPATWEELLEELDAKAAKNKDSLALLRVIFQKTHQRLLKNYSQHSTFSAMLDKGSYDCVSGSAALGLLLDRYGYAFDVIETDYHVFIQVYLGGKTLILESTLPVGGMITSATAVNTYLSNYLDQGIPTPRNVNEGLAGAKIDAAENSTFRKVTLTELAGLQHYNEAIVQFNKQEYKIAIDLLTKALTLYPTERIEGLKDLSIDLAYHSYGYNIRK